MKKAKVKPSKRTVHEESAGNVNGVLAAAFIGLCLIGTAIYLLSKNTSTKNNDEQPSVKGDDQQAAEKNGEELSVRGAEQDVTAHLKVKCGYIGSKCDSEGNPVPANVGMPTPPTPVAANPDEEQPRNDYSLMPPPQMLSTPNDAPPIAE
jgi:hypothetical protein